MAAPSLSLCMIVKDEENNLGQCLDSVRGHADELVVVDTGSTDRTREVAVEYGASVYQFDQRNHPEAFFVDDEATCAQFGAPGPFSGEWALGDFAAARNESFLHATGDYVAWIDADDVLENPEKLREAVSDMAKRGFGIGFLAYNYAQDHLGRVYYRQWRERVFCRGLGSWVNPVHEVYMPASTPGALGRYDAPVYSHRRKADRKSIPNRNYKILLRQAWQLKTASPDQPLDPRILFYLGQEARFIEPKKAVGFYCEYLGLSGWPEERAAAHVALGSLLEYGAMGIEPKLAYAQADLEYAAAAAEMPDNPDGLLGLARVAYLRGRFNDCISYTERAFKVGNTDSMLGSNPQDRLYRPHIFLNHALAQVGRVEEAIRSCEDGLKAMPDDPGVPGGAPGMLRHNLSVYRDHLAQRAAQPAKEPKVNHEFSKDEDVDAPAAHGVPRDVQVIWSMQLWKQIVAAGDGKRARAFLEALPSSVTSDPVIQRMFESTDRRFGSVARVAAGVIPAFSPPDCPRRSSVVFWIGPGLERWDPTTPNSTGLGGSETAAVEMAKNLAGLGCAVRVYAEAEGVYDGVSYLHHSKFDGRSVECDALVVSRAPWVVEAVTSQSVGVKVLWVHDIHCGPNSPKMERWLYAFDRVLCLSEWHRGYFLSCYRSLHEDRVAVTRNGVDPWRFSVLGRKENRIVFSSSPNRGLLNLLANMPFVRARVPDVHLDVFYGFDTWETMARSSGDQPQLDEIARYRAAIDQAVETGAVTWRGKSSQRVLADAFLRAKVWGYPSDFPETSCISAMEAQAAGCVPVTSRFAALPETVRHGVLIDPGPEYGRQFVDHCVRLMTDEAYRSGLAEPGRRWAMENLSWAAVARDWVVLFDSVRNELATNPVPAWRSA